MRAVHGGVSDKRSPRDSAPFHDPKIRHGCAITPDMRGVARLLLAISVAWAWVCPSFGQTNVQDPWETALPPVGSCREVEPDLVIPVAAAARSEAISMLTQASVLPLSDSQLSRLAAVSNSDSSAAGHVTTIISRLTRQKEEVLRTSVGSWNGTMELRLIQLERLQASPRLAELRPFLVRGVAGNEHTGEFFVQWCGGDLTVRHSSLGATRPPGTRVPVVVYLEKLPNRVLVGYSVAR